MKPLSGGTSARSGFPEAAAGAFGAVLFGAVGVGADFGGACTACGAGAGNVSGLRGAVLAGCAVGRAAGFVALAAATLVDVPFAGEVFAAGREGFFAAVLVAALVFATERGAFAASRAGALALASFRMC